VIPVANTKIIEIVSSFAALDLLKRGGNKNKIVCLPLALGIGKLESLTPFNRKELSKYLHDTNSYDFTNVFTKLKSDVTDSVRIRVWASHLDSDNYCLFLFICFLFKNNEISVVFSEEMGFDVTTVECLTEKEIEQLEKREHILKKIQKEEFSKEWERVVSFNKELRYMINGTVVSCDINYFDNDIIARLDKSKKIYFYSLVADLMGNPIIPNVLFPDYIYIYLIERLEKNHFIKITLIDGKKYVELI